jgi:hypothetical protein
MCVRNVTAALPRACQARTSEDSRSACPRLRERAARREPLRKHACAQCRDASRPHGRPARARRGVHLADGGARNDDGVDLLDQRDRGRRAGRAGGLPRSCGHRLAPCALRNSGIRRWILRCDHGTRINARACPRASRERADDELGCDPSRPERRRPLAELAGARCRERPANGDEDASSDVHRRRRVGHLVFRATLVSETSP